MFRQIFLFEIKYRLHRPAAYIYFVLFFFFAFMSFAQGALPLQDKELYNAPAMLSLYSTMISIFMMLPASAIMGMPLYRDIEHNTKDYYLTYPITRPGYFWGRFLGSFVFVVLIGSAVYWGAWAGTIGGPAFRWSEKVQFGPLHFYHYLYPFLTIMLPNLFFMSAFFFGLVAVFRNVKVIYSSGLFLFLGYIISNFFFRNTANTTVIYLWDPFAFTPMRVITQAMPAEALNNEVVPVNGLLLGNRALWVGVGALVLLWTYGRFSFGRFFAGSAHSGKKERAGVDWDGRPDAAMLPVPTSSVARSATKKPAIDFSGSYSRKVLYSLTRVEILNIVRDNYFWIIMTGGLSFLVFLYWNSFSQYSVPDFPRASFFMGVYIGDFSFFIFILLMFYTGETVHRETVTRYAFINDSLPPPDWLIGSAKVISLLSLAIFLSLVPVLLGVIVQTLKGYHHYDFQVYLTSFFVMVLPKLVEIVLFCYAIQNFVRNKFAGYGIGILIWVLMWGANDLGYFTYLPMLYGNLPFGFVSDMDLAGHMLKPLLWFHLYWWLAGGCLLILAFLFLIRGTNNHFSERLRLARQRYRGWLRPTSLVLLAGFLAAGSYIYYNVSILNAYLTPMERDQRRAQAERELKHFEKLPLPTVTRARFQTDLYPYEQRQVTKATVTIQNKLAVPIDTLLLDGDNLTEYALKYNGALLPYQCPLFYPRGKFNIFRTSRDSGDYRLYILPVPLLPGDTASVEIQSLISFRGFRNEAYGFNMLYNGSVYNGGLPGLGYDDDEELRRSDKRVKYGLPPRVEKPIAHRDPEGVRRLDASANFGLTPVDITVSTAGDQWAVAPGRLEKDWMAAGRHYFHYVQQGPGIYPPFLIFSARYSRKQDTVAIAGSSPVRVNLYYHPTHDANLDRLMVANKDGLRYMSDHFGAYPFGDFSLVEGSVFTPYSEHFPGITLFSDQFGWNAHFTDPKQNDYLYYRAVQMLAFQWWGGQVAPNHTSGSPILSAGISKYLSMVLMEKKYGKDAFSDIHFHEMYDYLFYRVRELRNGQKENNLLNADNASIWLQKAGLVFFGLKDLAGEENINAALREFHEQWAFRDHPPYPGSEDLYTVLQRHMPDSLRYYLTDTWEKVTLYDNKIVDATSEPVTTGGYKLTLRVLIRKIYIDSAGQDHPATGMKDYIDIGVFGAGYKQLYLKKLPFSEGEHRIEIHVPDKPEKVAIDPYMNLIDRIPEDNRKNVSP